MVKRKYKQMEFIRKYKKRFLKCSLNKKIASFLKSLFLSPIIMQNSQIL